VNHAYRDELSPLLFLERAARAYGDRTALVDGPLSRSYAELAARAQALANALAERGVEPGDRVAILAPNRAELLEAHFGVPAAGALLVPLNIRLSPSEIARILVHARPRVLLVDPDLRASVEQGVACAGPLVLELGAELEAALAAAPAGLAPASWPDDEEQPIAINYTSGTTGQPKGVVYTHRGAYLNALGEVVEARLDPDSRYLWTLPMFHCDGWCYPWAVVAAGGVQVCLRRVDPAEVWRELKAGGTHLCGAPTVLISLVNHEDAVHLGRPFTVVTAAAPPSPTVLARMEALGARLVHVYGLTETYGPFTVSAWRGEWDELPADERARLRARQGVPFSTGGGLRVVDEHGADVPADGRTLGEVVMRGNGVMAGYYADAEATAEAFRGGWFHSGDAGVLHPDGYVELRDRFKDVIISGGENVSTIEVEQVLARHPAVLEAAVVGVPHEHWGERPVAYVTLVEGTSAEPQELISFCRESLAHYKCPDAVTFGALPKTSTGKVRKQVLRERARTGS
jgi:fatty-acyl-CoA synthase